MNNQNCIYIFITFLFSVPLKPDQACHARDALSKALYLRLFDWIIKRVNKCFPFTTSRYYIGVLDIAGFGKHGNVKETSLNGCSFRVLSI